MAGLGGEQAEVDAQARGGGGQALVEGGVEEDGAVGGQVSQALSASSASSWPASQPA